MNLRDIKHHECPIDEKEGTLLVDFDTESVPVMDENGNYLYYCDNDGGHTFAVEEDRNSYSSRWRK